VIDMAGPGMLGLGDVGPSWEWYRELYEARADPEVRCRGCGYLTTARGHVTECGTVRQVAGGLVAVLPGRGQARHPYGLPGLTGEVQTMAPRREHRRTCTPGDEPGDAVPRYQPDDLASAVRRAGHTVVQVPDLRRGDDDE